jgi:hypothetical protein
MMVDERIAGIVDGAIEKYPNLFVKPNSEPVKAVVGGSGASGQCLFFNFKTGYAYCFYAYQKKYYIGYHVSKKAEENLTNEQKIKSFNEVFMEIFNAEKVEDLKDGLCIVGHLSKEKRVDVTSWEDLMIIEYMAKLIIQGKKR